MTQAAKSLSRRSVLAAPSSVPGSPAPSTRAARHLQSCTCTYGRLQCDCQVPLTLWRYLPPALHARRALSVLSLLCSQPATTWSPPNSGSRPPHPPDASCHPSQQFHHPSYIVTWSLEISIRKSPYSASFINLLPAHCVIYAREPCIASHYKAPLAALV